MTRKKSRTQELEVNDPSPKRGRDNGSQNNQFNSKIPPFQKSTSNNFLISSQPVAQRDMPLDANNISMNSIPSSINNNLPQEKSVFIDFINQKDNRYLESSPGPFVVEIIDADPENNLGNFHIVTLGLKIFNAGFKVTALKKIGLKKVSLSFFSYNEANDFVERGILLVDRNWKTYIPDIGIFSIGIISGVPSELTKEEII